MKITVFGASGRTGRLLVEQAVAAGHEVTVVVRRVEQVDIPTGAEVSGGRGAETGRVAEMRTGGPAEVGPVPRASRTKRPGHSSGSFTGRVVPDLLAGPVEALEDAVRGADAVISCLGPRSGAEAREFPTTASTTRILRAMTETQVRRLVVISAAPIDAVPSPARPGPFPRDPGDDLLTRRVLYPLIRRILRGQYADLARMEDAVHAGGRDWTVVRPPRLFDGPATGVYRTDAAANLPGGRSLSRADLAHALLAAATGDRQIGQTVRVAY